MYLFDKNEELISIIDPEELLESQQVQELNGLINTTVSAPYSTDLEDAFYIGSRDVDDNGIFWMYKVDKRTKEGNSITLNGTYVLFDELKAYGLIRDKRPKNVSALSGITTILEGSRWQVGNITSTHLGTANWYYISRLEAFWEYLEKWDVEFKSRMTYSKGKITGRYIDIADRLSDDYGKWYEYSDKLLTITAEQASDSLYTAFVGRGKGEEVGDGFGRRIGIDKVVWTTASGKPVNKPLNQDYIEIPNATAEHGFSDGTPRTTVVIFEDTEDINVLAQQTYDYALNECRPKLQMKANVIEDGLSELGETCAVIRDDRGIRYKTRVFKLTRDFLNKKQRVVEFGDEIVISAAKRNANVKDEIKKQEKQTIAWLDQINKELQDTFFNEDGYNYDLKVGNEYDLPAGLYSFNAPIDMNPTKLIYIGAGKMAIANSKLPSGAWNFRTWGTGDGFVADLIVAGVLRGAYMEHNLNVGESTYTNPATSETLILNQGSIRFKKGLQERLINYIDEGIRITGGETNTGTARNTSIHLNGGVDYLQFNSFSGATKYGRIQFTSDTALIQIPVAAELKIIDNNNEQAGITANYFKTVHNTGLTLEYKSDSIKTPRAGDRNIFLSPNGTGSVVAGESNGTRYNMVAADFVKQSSRASKTQINPLVTKGMDVLNRLTPVSYKKKDKLARDIDETELGFIAEDSMEVATKDLSGIYDSHIVTYLVDAMKEKDEQVIAMQEELKIIKETLNKKE